MRKSLLVLAVLGMATASWVVARHVQSIWRPALPVMAQVPAFSLVGSSGAPVTQAQFAGRVWVADFIFTKCPGMCPILTTQLSKLVRAVAAVPHASEVRFVSFSVDPLNDTPAALRDYAASHEADPERWLFVTGPRADLHRLIQDGFHLAVVEKSPEEAKAGELITHSDRFVLVDRELRIRGYYHGTEEGTVAQLTKDIERLLAE